MDTIRYGDRGPGVGAFQRALIARGHPLPRFGDDEHLGDETWSAGAACAAAHGIAMVPVATARAGRVRVPAELLRILATPAPAQVVEPVNVVDGLALYVRAIGKRHGTPAEFAAKCADHGLRWMAIGGPVHSASGRMINQPATVRRYADALARRGITPFVWGYPWQGSEERFIRELRACAGEHPFALLDPELGSNPARSKAAVHLRRAEQHARELVARAAEAGFTVCGLSTYGTGARFGWFPLRAFIAAQVEYFRGRSFVGGQTYTEDARIDPSITDFYQAIRAAGFSAADIELVPNFGTYSWAPKDPTKRISTENRKAVAKTGPELLVHLDDFVDNPEPVDALIGWAENFVTAQQWPVLRRFAERMARGACRLPPVVERAA